MTGEPSRLPPSLLTAEALIAWRGGVQGTVPENVILTHQESLFRSLVPRFRAKRISGLFPQVCVLPGTDDRVAIAGRIGVGGPATAMAVEELAVAGVRRIVMVDVAASITPGYVAGDRILALDAIGADGTSPHYRPDGQQLVPCVSELLFEMEAASRRDTPDLHAIQIGLARVASTDAPFREISALLDEFRAQDAIAVDMETAAFYASAAALGVGAAAALVIGDSLAEEWVAPPNRDVITESLRYLAEIACKVLLL